MTDPSTKILSIEDPIEYFIPAKGRPLLGGLITTDGETQPLMPDERPAKTTIIAIIGLTGDGKSMKP